MIRCLTDRDLLSLYEGEGTDLQRSHLTECEACSGKYERLGLDLKVIREVLCQDPPSQAVYQRPRAAAIRWAPALSALAVVIGLVWGGLWMRGPSPPSLAEPSHSADFWRVLEEFSADLRLLDDAITEPVWPQAELHAVAVSLGEESPCEWEETSVWNEVGLYGDAVGETGGEPCPCCPGALGTLAQM